MDTPNGHAIVTTQQCDDTIRAVHEARDFFPKRTKGDGARYLGSVPLIVCQIWAKECRSAIGTKEFRDYATKKLTSGDYSRFKAWLQ